MATQTEESRAASLTGARHRLWYSSTKRAMDILGALALLAATAPAFLLVAMLVRLTSPGPVFFRQERVGLNGATFRVLKFRSMEPGAAAR